MNQTFHRGDRVWFVSKFGDRVTGTYVRPEAIPGAHGEVRVWVIK